MVAANLNKMVEKNEDLLECERREFVWKCVGMKMERKGSVGLNI